ncbi:CBN-AGL-1 protein [Aphelenchoides avenae]|nr:CBN-AGL-1 protein [Aphelenchus avenae]
MHFASTGPHRATSPGSRPSVEKLKDHIHTANAHMEENPWTSLPELTNARGEVCGGSCPAQAWSVGCFLNTASTAKSTTNLKANSVSMRTSPLRIAVSPLRLEDEDLRDFAERLSYRHRGQPPQLRIYDFPAEQQGAFAAMRLQIALHPGNRLELNRAPLPNLYFYKPDEQIRIVNHPGIFTW